MAVAGTDGGAFSSVTGVKISRVQKPHRRHCGQQALRQFHNRDSRLCQDLPLLSRSRSSVSIVHMPQR